MTLETSVETFRWIENWITIPDSPLGRTNGRTHGVTVLKNGEVVIFHQADPAVLFYSPDGKLLKSWGCFPGAHGLTLVEENGVEFLWLTDESTKVVVKMSLEGTVVSRLAQPSHPAYADGSCIPTWVAVAEERFGGNGDVWVADGYGCSLVHRFDRDGNLLGTLDGTEGGGRFRCPHGLALDTRRPQPEFYIADRGNRRFQVYGMDGAHRRTFGEDFLNSLSLRLVSNPARTNFRVGRMKGKGLRRVFSTARIPRPPMPPATSTLSSGSPAAASRNSSVCLGPGDGSALRESVGYS
jgi:hypothetical protein